MTQMTSQNTPSVATLDTRGFSCPQPVLMAHAFWQEHGSVPLDVLVDNEASRENVTRAAHKRGLAVTPHETEAGCTRLELRSA